MDERFEELITLWVQAFALVTKLLARCGTTLPTADPAIPGLTRPAVARAIQSLDDPTIPEGVRRAVAAVVVKWLTIGDHIDDFEADEQPWRYRAIVGLLDELHALAEIAIDELDGRDQAN